MKRQPRWMKSVIETSKTDLPQMPWAARKTPPAPVLKSVKTAA